MIEIHWEQWSELAPHCPRAQLHSMTRTAYEQRLLGVAGLFSRRCGCIMHKCTVCKGSIWKYLEYVATLVSQVNGFGRGSRLRSTKQDKTLSEHFGTMTSSGQDMSQKTSQESMAGSPPCAVVAGQWLGQSKQVLPWRGGSSFPVLFGLAYRFLQYYIVFLDFCL